MGLQLPSELVMAVEKSLGCKILDFHSTYGGCINSSGKLKTSLGTFFIKWNDRILYPEMLRKEAEGLQHLHDTHTIDIPEVMQVGETESEQYLILSFIESEKKGIRFWEHFGERLAALHQSTSDYFGLEHDNFIGSLPQINTKRNSWVEFYKRSRLIPQIQLASNKGLLPTTLLSKLDRLIDKLSSLIVDEKPSLLHGDLWSGNLMVNARGEPSLIDPSIYYGNREMDLAMAQLFGGFDERYIDAYNAAFPLTPGFNDRLQIYQLYPLLVHVNLFGESYVPRLVSITRNFV